MSYTLGIVCGRISHWPLWETTPIIQIAEQYTFSGNEGNMADKREAMKKKTGLGRRKRKVILLGKEEMHVVKELGFIPLNW